MRLAAEDVLKRAREISVLEQDVVMCQVEADRATEKLRGAQARLANALGAFKALIEDGENQTQERGEADEDSQDKEPEETASDEEVEDHEDDEEPGEANTAAGAAGGSVSITTGHPYPWQASFAAMPDRILWLFQAHPETVFTVGRVLAHLKVGDEQQKYVYTTIGRLAERGRLQRVDKGRYRLTRRG